MRTTLIIILHKNWRPLVSLIAVGGLILFSSQTRAADPLPSWSDTAPKQGIVAFVQKVTQEGGDDFVPPAERIAVFDNDGTLWCEQPAYFQVFFAFDRIKAMAGQHPEWREKEPFKSVLENNPAGIAATGEKGLFEILTVTHTGMTADDFTREVKAWIDTAQHPKFKQPYKACVYQPMLELLAYLRANGFKTFIVSGGGVEFMRAFAEETYGIPPEQVVGSSGEIKLENRDGKLVLVKMPKVEFIDDGPGKPLGINRFIGRQPIFVFGNSDGDKEMLEWVAQGKGPSFMGLVHHDDAAREYAYDRQSKIGHLDKAWDEAVKRDWTVVSMKNDWKTIFPFLTTNEQKP